MFVMHHDEKLEFDSIAQTLQLPLAAVLRVYATTVAKIWQRLPGWGR